MDWNRIEGSWKQVKGKVKEKWGKLTDDDLNVIAGKRDQLEGKIQERYFKQARNCANDMGLTVTSRCRLVVPDTGKQATEDSNPMLELIRGGMDRYA